MARIRRIAATAVIAGLGLVMLPMPATSLSVVPVAAQLRCTIEFTADGRVTLSSVAGFMNREEGYGGSQPAGPEVVAASQELRGWLNGEARSALDDGLLLQVDREDWREGYRLRTAEPMAPEDIGPLRTSTGQPRMPCGELLEDLQIDIEGLRGATVRARAAEQLPFQVDDREILDVSTVTVIMPGGVDHAPGARIDSGRTPDPMTGGPSLLERVGEALAPESRATFPQPAGGQEIRVDGTRWGVPLWAVLASGSVLVLGAIALMLGLRGPGGSRRRGSSGGPAASDPGPGGSGSGGSDSGGRGSGGPGRAPGGHRPWNAERAPTG